MRVRHYLLVGRSSLHGVWKPSPRCSLTGHAERVTAPVPQDADSNPVVVSDVRLPLPGVWATVYLPPGSAGRFLALRRRDADGGVLTLCEMRVYGEWGCLLSVLIAIGACT